MARIAVLNVGSFSHASAASRVGLKLAGQGHEVIAIGQEMFRERNEAAGASFMLHHPELAGSASGLELAIALARTSEQACEELIEQLFAQSVELVVHDVMVPWARIAGDFLGLPRLGVQPGFPARPPGAGDEDEDDADGEPAPEIKQAAAEIEKMRLSIARRWRVDLGSWTDVLFSDGALSVCLTTEELVGDCELPSRWRFVGPLLDPPPPPDRAVDPPLVYVCFGTTFNGRAELFKIVIEALAHEPVRVLVSTGNGPVSAAELEPLPPNVVVEEFIDGRATLARASVHVTHGGSNTMHESLLAGVPMVIMPQAADQFGLASRMDALGAGVTVEEKSDAVRQAVRCLLEDERARARVRELGEHVAGYDGEGRLAAVIAEVLASEEAVSLP